MRVEGVLVVVLEVQMVEVVEAVAAEAVDRLPARSGRSAPVPPPATIAIACDARALPVAALECAATKLNAHDC